MRDTISITADSYELHRIIMQAILPDAKWPEIYQAMLPANRIIIALKELMKHKCEYTEGGWCKTCGMFDPKGALHED